MRLLDFSAAQDNSRITTVPQGMTVGCFSLSSHHPSAKTTAAHPEYLHIASTYSSLNCSFSVWQISPGVLAKELVNVLADCATTSFHPAGGTQLDDPTLSGMACCVWMQDMPFHSNRQFVKKSAIRLCLFLLLSQGCAYERPELAQPVSCAPS